MQHGEHILRDGAQESLARVAGLLDMLFATAEDSVFIMDGVRIVDCNPATLRMFGCASKHEIIGTTVVHFSPATQLDGETSLTRAERITSDVMAGSSQTFEWRHSRLDGSEFDAEVRLNRFDIDGRTLTVAMVRDITERKAADEALRRQLRAADLINGILGRYALSAPHPFDAHVNSALSELSELIGADHAYVFITSPDRSTYSCTHEACGEGVSPLHGSYQDVAVGTHPWIERVLMTGETVMVDGADGTSDATSEPERRSMLLVPTHGTSAQFSGAIGIESHSRQMKWSDHDIVLCSIMGNAITGVMERRRAAERILEEKQFSDRIVESLPGIFYLYDSQYRLQRWNKNFESAAGGPEKVQATLVANWIADEQSRTRVLEAAQRVLEGGAVTFIEADVTWDDGETKPYIFSGARFDSAQGPMLVGLGIDISERRRAEQALAASFVDRERLMNELQAASSAKDQFLAVLSHELRNPLAAIQAGTGLIRHVLPSDDSRLTRALDVIDRNVRFQARLVDDLLDLSRLVRGKLAIHFAPLQLDETVLAAVQTCQADAARAKVALRMEFEPNLWVDADAERIQQVVINLVGNAIKFTPERGQVTIAVVAHGASAARIIVEDTGVGIEPRLLPELFEMFRQGEIAAQRASGLGIGLALVKALIELHKGRVWAESEGIGRGSRFTVELARCDAPEAVPPPTRHAPPRTVLRMLLVEDRSDTRALLAETFSALCYDVLAVDSAEAALEILASESIDIIVADIGLPGMDGYELLERARSTSTGRTPPAFALTGYGQESDVERARSAGYAEHFVKPVDAEVLDRHIRAHLSEVAPHA